MSTAPSDIASDPNRRVGSRIGLIPLPTALPAIKNNLPELAPVSAGKSSWTEKKSEPSNSNKATIQQSVISEDEDEYSVQEEEIVSDEDESQQSFEKPSSKSGPTHLKSSNQEEGDSSSEFVSSKESWKDDNVSRSLGPQKSVPPSEFTSAPVSKTAVIKQSSPARKPARSQDAADDYGDDFEDYGDDFEDGNNNTGGHNSSRNDDDDIEEDISFGAADEEVDYSATTNSILINL